MSPRTPEENSRIREQTRQQILDAAFELFANQGYSRTSIATIAKNAGVSKGLIYHYFESKSSIFNAIFDQLVQVGEKITDFPGEFTATDKIRYALEGIFRFIEEHTDKARLMLTLALQPDTLTRLKPKVLKASDAQMVLFIEVLEELGYEQPELEAYHLGAIMDGILMGYITKGDEYPLDKMKQKILDEYVPN